MSARFIAHVERPDGSIHHIDCDATHEDGTGRLALTINTYVGAIAAYTSGAWVSYVLDAAPQAVKAGIDFTGSGMNAEQQEEFRRRWDEAVTNDVPRPVTHAQVIDGEKSLNDYRRWLGMPALNIACAVVHRDHDGNVIPCPCVDCGGSRACPACEGQGHRDGERCCTCESHGTCPTCRRHT